MSDDGQRTQSKPAEEAASLPNAWKPGRVVNVEGTLYLDDGRTWIELPTGGEGGGGSTDLDGGAPAGVLTRQGIRLTTDGGTIAERFA